MSKKGIFGLALAIVLPIVAYLATDFFAKKFTDLPPKYYAIGVQPKEVRGRKIMDTIYHTVANQKFVNQLGDSVDLDMVRGKITVCNFFFTSCASICPPMTYTMRKLQKSFDAKSADSVQFISFSIDPTHDTPEKMKAYADNYNIKHSSWWMLRGDTSFIYKWGEEQFKLGSANPNGNPNAANVHTDQFVLLDRKRIIRGYYHSRDTMAVKRLLDDVAKLIMEKSPYRKGLFD
jgi:protein SCO1